jgi:hypothetical protein
MNRLVSSLCIFGFFLQINTCLAQQSETFGDYEVHYNVINSNLLPAQVAQGYGISRSSNRALVNIAVLDTSQGDYGTAVIAEVTTNAINLTGQRREVEMKEILDPEGAIYYIGEMPIHNLESYNFSVMVTVEGGSEPFKLEFRQQFYTE